jgi:uncharacterized protein (DUF1499 family)
MANQQQVSKMATVSVAFMGVALPAMAIGAFGAHFEILPTFAGFGIFFLGIFLGILAFITGGIGLLHTRAAKGLLGRNLAAAGFVIGGVITLSAVGLSVPGGEYVPPINDITTDQSNPPAFDMAAAVKENRGQDMSYPSDFADQQREFYPDIQPIQIELSTAEAFERAREVAQRLHWEIIAQNKTTFSFEATDTSSFFHFVDDISVRVRPAEASAESACIIDIRSRSRMGQGDLGANAARIRAFREALEKTATAQTN